MPMTKDGRKYVPDVDPAMVMMFPEIKATMDRVANHINDGGHEWIPSPSHNNELVYCKRCGSFEGATTTHCPGAWMDMETSDRVYKGEIDYRDGQWCNQPAIGMSHVYGTKRDPYVALCNLCHKFPVVKEGACRSCWCEAVESQQDQTRQ